MPVDNGSVVRLPRTALDLGSNKTDWLSGMPGADSHSPFLRHSEATERWRRDPLLFGFLELWNPVVRQTVRAVHVIRRVRAAEHRIDIFPHNHGILRDLEQAAAGSLRNKRIAVRQSLRATDVGAVKPR